MIQIILTLALSFVTIHFSEAIEIDFFSKLNEFNTFNLTGSPKNCYDLKCIGTESYDKMKDFISAKLYNGDKWAKYRLGDVVILEPAGNTGHWDPNFYDNVLYHQTDYPGSIAEEYIRKFKNSPSEHNIMRLLDIIKQRKKKNNSSVPSERALYLHIRVGDVMCKQFSWISDADFHYSKKGDDDWWRNLVACILNSNIDSIVIIAGCHYNECLGESAEYIIDRTLFLMEKTKLPIKYELGNSPDDDIIKCSDAKHFVSTGGHYGRLLKIVSQS